MKRLGEITEALIAHGRSPTTPAVVVQWGTWPRQRVLEATVADVAARAAEANIANPSVVVIGEVGRLRETMRWFDRLPLFGKRIVVTRPEHQAEETANEIRARGAEPVVVPAISIHPPPDPAALERSLSMLDAYDVVAFTSANGVARSLDALAAARRDARAFGRALVAAIGPGTEAELSRRGIVADIVAAEFRGEGLAASILEALRARTETGTKRRVLLLRALVARDALPDALRAGGVEVEVTAVYETKPAPPTSIAKLRADLSSRAVDVVTFTSSSTVTELCRALGSDAAALLGNAVVAVIGPVTAETARGLGVRVDVSAEPFTVAGLLDALERHFASRPAS